MQLLGAAIWEYLYIYIYIYISVCVLDFESIKMCCKKHRLPTLGTMPIAPTLEYIARRRCSARQGRAQWEQKPLDGP